MKHKTLFLTGLVSLAVLMTGCGEKKETVNIESDSDILGRVLVDSESIDDVDKNFTSLSEWNGTWSNFAEYCSDEKLEDTWGIIADRFGIDEDMLKNTFERICFVTDDLLSFEIKDGTITAYDAENKEIFSHKYSLVGLFSSESERTVIEGEKSYLFRADEEAGRYNYICLMPICHMESSHSDFEMADHFHFNYGHDAETATNRSGIPTMLQGEINDTDKQQTLLQFFFGSTENNN